MNRVLEGVSASNLTNPIAVPANVVGILAIILYSFYLAGKLTSEQYTRFKKTIKKIKKLKSEEKAAAVDDFKSELTAAVGEEVMSTGIANAEKVVDDFKSELTEDVGEKVMSTGIANTEKVVDDVEAAKAAEEVEEEGEALTLEKFLEKLKNNPNILSDITAKQYYNMFPDNDEKFKTLLVKYKNEINDIMTRIHDQLPFRSYHSGVAIKFRRFQDLIREFEKQ